MKHLPGTTRAGGRLAALAGVAFVGMALAAPDPSRGVEHPSADQVRQFYLDNQQSLRASLLLGGLAYGCFLTFLAVLGTELRRSEGGDGTVSRLAVAAGVLVAGFHLIAITLWVAPALVLTDQSDPALVGAAGFFGDVSRNALVEVSTVWCGVLLAAVAVVAIRHRALPRWLGWITAGLAVGSLFGLAGFVESPLESIAVAVGFSAYVGFHVWVLVASMAVAFSVRTATASRAPSHSADRGPVEVTG